MALDGENSALAFHDCLGQRKPQTDALAVARSLAAVKTLKYVMDVFRGNSAAVV